MFHIFISDTLTIQLLNLLCHHPRLW